MHVVVVGGGAIGVMIAYNLGRRDIQVTLLEATDLGHGASLGNAGLLVPSYSLPLTSYENAIEGARSILGASSTVHVKLPLSLATVSWCARFLAAARPSAVERGLETLAMLTRDSVELYDELLADAPHAVAYDRGGALYVTRTDAAMLKSVKLAKRLSALGIRSQVMTGSEARGCEPTLSSSVVGAVWYPDDARLQPLNFTRFVATLAVAAGVTICTDRVTAVTREGGRAVGVRTASKSVAADKVVIAAGAWSPQVAKSIGLRVPTVPAKGYSLDLKLARSPHMSMLFSERHVTLTPANDVVRATTGLDFHAFDPSIAPRNLELMRVAYREYLDEPCILSERPGWAGFRPLTPDGLPIVGPSSRVSNLLFATGHGPLGVTLAPVTAKLIASSILGGSVKIPKAIQPSRFGI